ncbi:transposase [Sphingobium sp. Ant17]|nr:transposase [Sphingobium sp. Ant17]
MRLILHTAAYWLMWRIPAGDTQRQSALAAAEFATLRLRLLKVAARVIETATRIRIAFASACPEASTFRAIAAAFRPAPT